MDYLLDTTTISYILDNEPTVMRRFERLYPSDHAYTSVVNEAELLFGASKLPGVRGRELLNKVDQILDRLDDVLPPLPVQWQRRTRTSGSGKRTRETHTGQ